MSVMTIEKIRNAVGADYDCVYELRARSKDELVDMIRTLVGYIKHAEKTSYANEMRNTELDELLRGGT